MILLLKRQSTSDIHPNTLSGYEIKNDRREIEKKTSDFD